MTQQAKKEGYPTADKPWLKYYTQEQISAELPKCKIYDYIWQANKDYKDKTALNYYDRRISYGQLFENIRKTACAFMKLGVKLSDIVGVLAVTLPETVYTLYGLNRIGAVSNMIDPRTSVEGIRAYLEESKTTVVVAMDVVYEKVVEAIKGTNVSQIVVISAADSLEFPKKQIYRLFKAPKIPKGLSYIKWKDFISSDGGKVEDSPYISDDCCVIVHTGGTTGTPKGVMLSNDNLNCSAFQCFNSSLDFQRHHSWADIMPPFIAYGVGNGLHLPLSVGMEVILIPSFDPNKFDELLIKHRPTHMAGVPSHYENVMNSPKMVDADLSYLISPIVGGDIMKIDLENSVNAFIKQHGVKNRMIKGYGMTEVSAADSVCTSNDCNKVGSVGIPFAHTIISIFDPESGEELPYNQKGEVCMTGPNTMIGYYGNPEETEKILRKHNDDLLWVHSGDLGYMDEDGVLFVEGRLKRMIVRYDGFKVYPNMIETVIQKNKHVNTCCAVGKDDYAHAQGRLPVVYIVLKENVKSFQELILSEIQILCEEELPEYAQPIEWHFIERLPLTPIGKVDYMSLEKMTSA